MSTQPNTPSTSQADKDKLLELLRESRKRFLGSFAGVTKEQSPRRPAEASWSVADCVEHVAAAETFMLRLLQAPRRPRPAGAPNREKIFLQRMTDRTSKVTSPEGARPTGRFGSLEAAEKQFETARAGTIRFVEESTDDLRATEITHGQARRAACITDRGDQAEPGLSRGQRELKVTYGRRNHHG